MPVCAFSAALVRPALSVAAVLVAPATWAVACAGTAAAVDPSYCEKLKSPAESFRLTFYMLSPADPLKTEDRFVTVDLDRSDPSRVVMIQHLKTATKTVLLRNGMTIATGMPERNIENRFEYEGDPAQYRLIPGASFSLVTRMLPNKGEASVLHHDYAVTDGGKYSIGPCSFDVVAVHHVVRTAQGQATRETITDTLYAPELVAVVKTHIKVAAVGFEAVMIATDIGPLTSPQ